MSHKTYSEQATPALHTGRSFEAEFAGPGELLSAARELDVEFRNHRRPILERRLIRHDRVWMPLLHTACTGALAVLLGRPLVALISGRQSPFMPEDPSQRIANPLGWAVSLFGGLFVILCVLTCANVLVEEWGRRYRERLCEELGSREPHRSWP